MKITRVLILEDDLLTLSKLLNRLYLLGEKLLNEDKDLAVTVLSEYTQVEEYINRSNNINFDIVLLDRDCKAGGSFHILNISKIGVNKIIGISSVPSYNEELRKSGVTKIVYKDYRQLDNFAEEVTKLVKELITQ